ncbi:Het-C-domain-containing protein [Exidia glandulosa HHB12029]|uniref:Het-C-domain-containing protein n=1 Tax=Exidia glandulosa HHB12029 TaxID=1314781 RepID=A0A165MYQ1_EXIGL|nr:Het-C-domain-containing protein [Exidia glandulosa HHB12029]
MGVNVPLILTLVVVLCVVLPATPGSSVYAFGAGNIPSFAYLEGKAFRHGDIEDILSELAKGAGGGIIGSVLGKSKFGGLDIKRVYFGNWLRDYSQAVDIAGLKKLPLQTIVNLCMVLGFLAHGYATNEFEVTPERLGVYLPTEHIDNPKGYGEGEDARKYHPLLRGPVDPQELEVDIHTGMKNYIANEHGHWDTSKALVRKRLEECIRLGRQWRQTNQKADLYECFRLLGTALHTLEDFPAHSNFCELALVAQGHTHVFCHVGDHVRIKTHGGKMVAPLVTGTFGSSDFIHSLLGEASDHISEASVSDLNREMSKASQKSRGGPGGKDSSSMLRDLFFQLPGGGGNDMARDMDGIERLRAAPQQGGKKPEEMSPQELHAVLWQVLSFRDSVVKKIEKTIEKIPGLGPLIEKLMDSISVFIFTTLEPYIKPLLKTASGALQNSSAEVINNHDQYEVFNDPRASDPTHSFLSKDHFNLILNETAGNIAMIIVRHTVRLVQKAWDDKNVDVKRTTDEILECLFHPEYHNSNSAVQREMLQYMRTWLQGHGHKQHEVLSRLTKESVRNHNNIRLSGDPGGAPVQHGANTQGSYNTANNAAHNAQNYIQGYINQIPGVSTAQNLFPNFPGSPGAGHRREADAPGFPGAAQHGHSHVPPPGAPPHVQGPPPPTSGEAASFFGSGPPAAPYQPPAHSPYSPPPGPPGHSPYGAPPGPPPGSSPYSAPSGPPPSFPGGPGGGPGFPSPGFPAAGGYGSPPPPGGFGFPNPDVGFPGASPYGAPPGPPPGFPQGPAPGSGYPGAHAPSQSHGQWNYGGGPPSGY